MYSFCTFFDHNYLVKGLALNQSLERVCEAYRLFILCLSDECYRVLESMALKNVVLIPLVKFEGSDSRLLEAKLNRSLIEYYFSCKPFLISYIFNGFPEVDLLTYVDSDLFFFNDPGPVFEEMQNCSIAITGHRFPPALKDWTKFGKYNTGWMSFRRDNNGLSCLEWYSQKCVEWCYDRPEAHRYADQKYLDLFSIYFNGVREIKQKGANLAPWNLGNYNLALKAGGIFVDQDPLIFFHFHGLKRIFGNLYDSGLRDYKTAATDLIRREIYIPYLVCLKNQANSMRSQSNLKIFGGIRHEPNQFTKPRRVLYDLLRNVRRALIVLYSGSYIYCKS